MTLIDQRILIDAPIQLVWEFLSDPERQAAWHAGYSGISILTTQQVGQGVRRRCAPAGEGKDVIEEITAWVDGLGYEYRVVEGGSYRWLKGRFRLQPVPDGTSVQWTLSYQPRGLFGWLKNRLSGKREMTLMMATSLRQLRRQIDTLGVHTDDTYRSRVGIQGRLNVSERAQYQRRHAPPPGLDLYGASAAAGEVSPDDVPVSAPPTPVTPPVAPLATPSFVADLTAAPEDQTDHTASYAADTEPRPPAGLRAALGETLPSPDAPSVEAPTPFVRPTTPPEPAAPIEPAVRQTPPAPAETPGEPPAYSRPTPPRGIPSVQPTFARESTPAPQPAVAPPPPEPPTLEPPPSEPAPPPTPSYSRPTPAHGIPSVRRPEPDDRARPEQPRNMPPPTPKTDTGEMSIWEVFGLQRPSDQDAEALDELIREVETKETTLAPAVVPLERGRHTARLRHASASMGLRLRLALYAARVRLHRAHRYRREHTAE